MNIQLITAEQTLPLRAAVLRPGQPPAACVFAGDEDADTRHFGAIDADGRILGVASLYRVAHPDIDGESQFQLRGMAIDAVCRGQGLGALLIAAPQDYARSCGAALIWANARSAAMSFYHRLGYQTVSEEFEMPGIGRHYRVVKPLRSDAIFLYSGLA